MDNSYYSVDQIAKMLRMHPKTIQRYIREGKLSAVKIGKGWRVSGHDLSRFMEDTHTSTAAETTSDASARQSTTASAVVDIAVIGSEEAQRLIQSLNAMMNVKPASFGQATLYTQYIEANAAVRLTLWGNLPFTATVLDMVNTYLQNLMEETT